MLDNLDGSQTFALVAIAVAIAALLVLLALSLRAAWVGSQAAAAARRLGLALPADASTIERRVAVRARAALAGALLAALGFVAVHVSLLPQAAEGSGPSWMLFFAGAVASGSAMGVLLAATMSRAPQRSTVRFARARAVELADYVALIERVGARVIVAASIVAGAALIVVGQLWGGPGPSALALTMGALAVGSLVLFEVLGRRMVARAQRAGSPEELAWDDALRAWTLRDLVTAPIMLGAYSLYAEVMELSTTTPLGEASRVIATASTGVLLVVLVLLIVVAIVSIATRPQQHFLRRLWPKVAGGTS